MIFTETLSGLDEVTKELDKVQTEIDRLLQHQQWLVERKKELEVTANRLQAECQRERPDVTKSGKVGENIFHILYNLNMGHFLTV